MRNPDEFSHFYGPISKIVEESLEVTVTDPYFIICDVNFDFMDIIVMIMELEKYYKISIPDEDVYELIGGSVRDIVYYVADKVIR